MSYLGSKAQAGVFQRIIGQMPPHSVYVEPFFGSGRIFWIKRPAFRSVICDADRGVMNGWLAASQLIGEQVEVRAGDALQILPRLNLPHDALIYCDPPYLLSTRTSRHRYKHEMTDVQHAQLLTLLKAMKCRVMISGYPSKFYAEKLKSWRCISYRTRTRGRTVTECLWCNFPPPTELHDWRFAGRNFRERTHFKRVASRMTNKLAAMSPLKRGYLLHAIHQRGF